MIHRSLIRRQVAVLELVRPGGPRCVGGIGRNRRREREPGLRREDATQLPAAQQRAHHAGAELADREVVDEAADEPVAEVRHRVGPLGRQVVRILGISAPLPVSSLSVELFLAWLMVYDARNENPLL